MLVLWVSQAIVTLSQCAVEAIEMDSADNIDAQLRAWEHEGTHIVVCLCQFAVLCIPHG